MKKQRAKPQSSQRKPQSSQR